MTTATAKTNSAWTLPQSRKKSSAFAASMDTTTDKTFLADGTSKNNWDSPIGQTSKKPSVSGWNSSSAKPVSTSKNTFIQAPKSKTIAAPISKPIHSPSKPVHSPSKPIHSP